MVVGFNGRERGGLRRRAMNVSKIFTAFTVTMTARRARHLYGLPGKLDESRSLTLYGLCFPSLLFCSVCRQYYCTNAAHKYIAVSLALSWHCAFLSKRKACRGPWPVAGRQWERTAVPDVSAIMLVKEYLRKNCQKIMISRDKSAVPTLKWFFAEKPSLIVGKNIISHFKLQNAFCISAVLIRTPY